MNILVMKFGGSSLDTAESFSKIADVIVEKSKNHPHIVVVVSAMRHMTDELLGLAHKIHDKPPSREVDMLISAGERMSIAMLAMALDKKGKKAISFTGSQSGIITSQRHSEARIVDVRPSRLLSQLREKKIVIVAGFQGMSISGEITTLGRGGSDTSAVALAVALGANKVEFYKDVDGVYSEDPKINQNAIFYSEMNYELAERVAKLGRGVLHPRAVNLAGKNRIILHVLSYLFPQSKGTIISNVEKNLDLQLCERKCV